MNVAGEAPTPKFQVHVTNEPLGGGVETSVNVIGSPGQSWSSASESFMMAVGP